MMRFALCLGLLVGCFPEPDFSTGDIEPGADVADSAPAVRPPDAAPQIDRDQGIETDAELDAGSVVDPDAASPVEAPAIVGEWVSEGDDLSPLLAGPPAHLIRLEADFRADGVVTVALTNERLQRFDLNATYTLDASTDPASIVVVQTDPEPARLEGVWHVQGTVLTYEVAQTEPPIADVTPPTPSGGFGSTSDGAFGRDNVQTYRRVR
jgi:hypothetical protein